MTGTSRKIDRTVSGGSAGVASVRRGASSSGLTRQASSRAIETRGGFHASLSPILLSGPSATDVTATSATIIWTLNLLAPPGYHRARWKQGPNGLWSVTAYTETASYDAFVGLVDLPDEHAQIYFQAQSCAQVVGGEGQNCMAWAADPATSFYTACTLPIVYSAFMTWIDEEEQTLFVSWVTNRSATSWLRWRIYPSGSWTYCSENLQYAASHVAEFCYLTPRIGETYAFCVNGKNRCGTYGGWSAQHLIYIGPEGPIFME